MLLASEPGRGEWLVKGLVHGSRDACSVRGPRYCPSAQQRFGGYQGKEVSPADITAFAGNCMLQVGQVDRAANLIEEGITLFDDSFLRDRQLYSIHLADALVRPGPQRDLDAGAGWGMEAIQWVEGLDSTRTLVLSWLLASNVSQSRNAA